MRSLLSQFLIDIVGNPNTTPDYRCFVASYFQEDYDVCRRHITNITPKLFDDIRDNNGRALVHIVSILGDSHLLRIIIEHGIDVNVKDNFNKTPIEYLEGPYRPPLSNPEPNTPSAA